MAKIIIHSIGKLSENSHEGKILSEYLKRIPWSMQIIQLEIKGKLPIDKLKNAEADLIIKSIPKGNYIICLDERGNNLSSVEFAETIKLTNQPISIVIGGAYGLSDDIRKKADLILSFGRMTLPHMLMRIVLVEQIYRAYTINSNHPYHK